MYNLNILISKCNKINAEWITITTTAKSKANEKPNQVKLRAHLEKRKKRQLPKATKGDNCSCSMNFVNCSGALCILDISAFNIVQQLKYWLGWTAWCAVP